MVLNLITWVYEHAWSLTITFRMLTLINHYFKNDYCFMAFAAILTRGWVNFGLATCFSMIDFYNTA